MEGVLFPLPKFFTELFAKFLWFFFSIFFFSDSNEYFALNIGEITDTHFACLSKYYRLIIHPFYVY